jgi:biotin carboxyl carrier protein
MMQGGGRTRLRVWVGDLEAEVHDLGPEDLPAAGRYRDVRPIKVSADDRAAGIRRFEVTVDGWVFRVAVASEAQALLRERAGQGSTVQPHHGPAVVLAPMPGRVARLWVAEGATVEAGQRLLAIEAMKMENEVRAPRAGTIASIGVAVDSSVELGDELLTVR